MRLIDADKLGLTDFEILMCNGDYKEALKILIDKIDNASTAYDVDKVVKKLEENSVMRANSKTFYNNPQNGKYVDEVVLLSKAIEIVKKGVE